MEPQNGQEDLRDLQRKVEAYLGKNKTTTSSEPVQHYAEDEEQVRITITYGEKPKVTISPMFPRWRLHDAKSRGNVIEVLGRAVMEHYKAAQEGGAGHDT